MTGISEVPLVNGGTATIDAADADAVRAAGPWRSVQCSGKVYAQRTVQGPPQRLHTFLTGLPFTDHANGDGLDNRRSNLRAATPSQNSANQRRSSRNTSGYKGVGWYARTSRWRAYLGTGGKQHHLGYFGSPEAAARAYDAAARAQWGEFARVNFPDEERAA